MKELPALDALALSLHHAPGVYALLVGSGLSSAAGIPTGWQITLDLIEKIKSLDDEANIIGNKSGDDSIEWYVNKYKKEPNYSEVIKCVAKTSGDRQKVLEEFFTNREPTAAHKKIAQLVKAGKIKVIITTNFDRLLEQALTAEGIEPHKIYNEDFLIGAQPLVHSGCTIVKVNGDYLDTRIKNTKNELKEYPVKLNEFLDTIFDQYGLIVVGWSGEWDKALYDAMVRVSNRRYSFYWAAYKDNIAQRAEELIEQKDGRVISINGADEFFKELADKVEGLDRLKRPHPYSVMMALELAKKYCRDDQYAMEWAELLNDEVEKIREYVTGSDYPYNSSYKNKTSIVNDIVEKTLKTNNQTIDGFPDKTIKTLEGFQSRTEILRRAALICGRWGTEKANRELMAVIRSLTFEDVGFNETAIELRKFGAYLCFYWALTGLVEARQWQLVKELFDFKLNSTLKSETFVYNLPPQSWNNQHILKPSVPINRDYLNNYFFNYLKQELKDISLSGSRIDQLLAVTEFYISIGFILQQKANENNTKYDQGNYWKYSKPLWYFRLIGADKRIAIEGEYNNMNDDDKRFQIGLLGRNKEEFERIKNIFERIVDNYHY